MVIRLPELLLFAEDIWRKALARLGPATNKQLQHQQQTTKSNFPNLHANMAITYTPDADFDELTNKGLTTMASVENPTPPLPTPPPAEATPTTTTTTTTTTMAPSIPPDSMISKKRCWRSRTVHFTVFLAVFSTILSLLWVYTLTAELRRKAFDENMTRDYVLDNISMDNPDLVAYIRDIQLNTTLRQEPLNATQSPEEQFIVSQLQGKHEGVYFEYMSRAGAASTTGWLESNLGWRGVMVFTDPRSFFDAKRSTRNPKTRVLHACLSTDKNIKEITYHQEADVQVTKLGEGPNSLVLSKESLPATRLICFPLYSILLAYNSTTLDYLSLDSTEVQDELVLDTIPWDVIRVSVLSIHWGAHHTDAETKSIVDKLASHNYKLVKSLSTGKLVFLYNRRLKI